MKDRIFIFNPLPKDELSGFRGLGRYTRMLIKALPYAKVVTNTNIPFDSILVFPYLDFLKKPYIFKRISRHQIAVVHDLIKLKYPSHFPRGIRADFFLYLNKFLFKRIFDYVITDTRAVAEDVAEFFSLKKEKIFAIPPAVDEIFFKKKIEKKENFCVYVGDATYNKNLPFLADVVLQAGVKCFLVGKIWERVEGIRSFDHPELKPLSDFLSKIKEKDNFIFKGFLADKDLSDLYSAARVNLLLSIDEGFGFSPLEAGAVGTGSLLSNIPVLREVMDSAGVYVDLANIEKAARVLRRFFEDDEFCYHQAQLAHERAKMFNILRFRKAWLKIINSL